MIPVKIQCGCGQRYAFDAEPVNGRMATAVACPVCGVDGTSVANEIIAQTLATQPEAAPNPVVRLRTAPASATPVARSSTAAPRLPVQPATISTKLEWYEQLWIALPIALVAVGGAIGGGCGGLAWAINKTVFKKTRHPVLRYLWTGLISVSAVIVWLLVASFFLSLIKKR